METIKLWISAITCLGLVFGVRYMLGIAEEGIDFVTLGQDEL